MSQFARSALCLNAHEPAERLATWLLRIQQAVRSDRPVLPDDFMAALLGAGPVQWTASADDLEQFGLVSREDEEIRIVNRAGAGGCRRRLSRVLREQREALFPDP